MILSLKARNFLSIQDEQILDLVPSNKKDTHLNNIANIPNSKQTVLRSAGIFGANASGKSNTLSIFSALQYLVSSSANFKIDEKIKCYEPFRLSEETVKAPCHFEIEFIGPNQKHYIYSIEFNQDSICREELYFYQTSQRSNLFKRFITKDGKQTFSYGSYFKSKIKTIPCLKNNLYLSKAANTEGGSEILKEIYRYFISIPFITPNRGIEYLKRFKDNNYREKLSILLASADTGITEMKLIRRNINTDELNLPDDMPESLKRHFTEEAQFKTVLVHSGQCNAEFEISDESAGTQRLINIAPGILLALSEGRTVFIDELESNLHPHICELIIQLFNNPATNKKNGQLIFTSHNTSLMNQDFMRRDQIWFTQKDSKGATELFPLDSIEKVRKDSPFTKWYLDGRMEAIPEIAMKRIEDIFKQEK